MKQRRENYGTAWQKIGKAFPNLEMWYIGMKDKRIEKHLWNNA